MTLATTFLGLVPIPWATGTGSHAMKRIAAPMVGGIFTSFLLELMVYPVVYELWKWHFELKKELGGSPKAATFPPPVLEEEISRLQQGHDRRTAGGPALPAVPPNPRRYL